MTYEELKKIAQPHLREGDNLPSNAFLLLTQLHIPFKSKRQCEEEFGGKMTPLYNTPAFLEIDSDGNKTVYFNDSTKYWNFYIFHEIAHYILGHEIDSPQNEMDADLLACILIAPLENLPSILKSARDLSTICKIPIDKAEIYWQEIKDNFSTQDKNIWKYLSFGLMGIVVTLLGYFIFGSGQNCTTEGNETVKNDNQYQNATQITSKNENNADKDIYYITSSQKRYHIEGCHYIQCKDNLVSVTQDEVEKLKLFPCKACIKE